MSNDSSCLCLRNGRIEMRPAVIAKMYLRTMFPFARCLKLWYAFLCISQPCLILCNCRTLIAICACNAISLTKGYLHPLEPRQMLYSKLRCGIYLCFFSDAAFDSISGFTNFFDGALNKRLHTWPINTDIPSSAMLNCFLSHGWIMLDWCIRWHVRIDVMMFTLDASLGSEADALRTTRIIRSLWLGPSAAGCNQKV